LAGCAATTDLRLDVVDTNGDCAARFDEVKYFSFEVIATNGRCRLHHACLEDNDQIAGVAELAQAIKARFSDLLFEVSADDAQTFVLNGRPQRSCFPDVTGANANTPIFCGSHDLATASGGLLTIDLDAGDCPESIDLCPE
jgi:hypothetical protein